ncbi:hypothetical protein KJ966_02760 [bacterium]|nr:hypothetical protein [bacterium]
MKLLFLRETKKTGIADGIGIKAQFSDPLFMTKLGEFLYVTDEHRIRRIDPQTAEVRTFAGSKKSGWVDDSVSKARFYRLRGITADSHALYVSDCGNDTIRKIEIKTAKVTTLIEKGLNGKIDCPYGLTKLQSNVYFVQLSYNAIFKLNLDTLKVETLRFGS